MLSEIADILEQRAFFMGSSQDLNICERVLLGLPLDSTTSFRPGTRLAPYRIREVSEAVEEYSVYLDKSLEEIAYYDAGDVIIPFGNVAQSLENIEKVARYFLQRGKKLFSMGGEHLISLPLIKAYHDFYPDMVVIQMDAHADLRDDYLGEKLSHASVMRRVVEIIGDGKLYQLGIRSATREELNFARQHSRLYLDQFIGAIEEVKARINRQPAYISLDIDVLDPAFAPGTGTPEAGGCSSRDLLKMLHGLRDLDIVGFDLVEISPPCEQGDNTSILGAKILREALLSY